MSVPVEGRDYYQSDVHIYIVFYLDLSYTEENTKILSFH